jgi:pimeloyl-ACP methyl ester carboxylesterase
MPKHCTLLHGGLVLNYKLWEGAGPTLIILHGLGSDGRQFEDDAAVYAAAGYRVIVPDLRAHGQSEAPKPMTSGAMHVSVMAEDILALMADLQLPVAHFIGNSMGGVVALAIIKKSPESVLSLATFGTTYDLSFPAIVPFIQVLTGRLMGSKRLAKVTAKTVTKHDRTRDLILEIYPDLDIGMVHAVQKTLRKYDYIETAKSFAGPITILRGDGDTAINKELPRTLSALQSLDNVTVSDVTDAGHFTNTDQPERVQGLILDHLSGASA